MTTAVVLMAYGTPGSADEILPYYTDIRRGRPPTDEQLADLTRRYEAIGGLSPLAERTEAQRAALQSALDTASPGEFAVTLGLKHAAPMIEQAVGDAVTAGHDRVVGLVLAPHFSAFSVGQYLDRVRAAAKLSGVPVTGVGSWAIEPALIEFLAAEVRTRLKAVPAATRVLFTAHSLPQRIVAVGDPYPAELRSTADAVATAAGLAPQQWDLAWQSAGRTPEPWLGPDILQVIAELGERGDVEGVLVCACGFVSDHLEVLYDLDIEARAKAAGSGLAFDRTACVNDNTAVMAALAALVIAADDEP
ncbi:MAG TPA: ferrochelatase [Ilumatobacteraceae bacterium]